MLSRALARREVSIVLRAAADNTKNKN